MRKRGIALFVAALMIGALAFPAGANVNPFTDLRSDHWAYEAIVKLAAAGLIEGYPDGTFGGDRTFTRYEMAMVFARILARFENLIDQKIHEGIDAKTAQLAYEIEAVRKELSDRIDANYDELVRDTSDIRARLGLPPFDRSNRSGAGLTGDARAALAGQVSDEMLDQLRILLKEDLDDLARRVRDVERALLDERDVERIAREVIANALGGDVEDLEAAEGNPAGAAILLAKRVDELESTMADMALEFRGELAQLGVKVNVLDARVDRIERAVDRLVEQVGNVSFSGSNKTTFEQTAIDSVLNEVYIDPRDEDSDELERKSEFKNTFTLVVKATPAENVNVTATMESVNHLGEVPLDDVDSHSVKANLAVTTPGVLRSLQAGDLDRDEIASPFNKYTLVAKKFDDPDVDGDEKRGAHFDLVWGRGDSTNLHGFVSRTGAAEHAFGTSLSYNPSDAFRLSLASVRQVTTPDADPNGTTAAQSDTVHSAELKGRLAALDYSVVYATYTDGGDSAEAIEAHATLPISVATASFEYGKVDEDFTPVFAKDLEVGKDVDGNEYEFDGLDWLERYLTPAEDWLGNGESAYTAKLSLPILGIQTSAAMGQLVTLDGANEFTNDFTRFEVGGFNWAGIEAGVLYDRRTDQNDDVDNTMRATFGTNLLGVDIEATLHNRENEQGWTGAEDQKHTWVTAKREVNLLLPLQLEGRFGNSQTAAAATSHTYIGVSVDKYPVGPLALSAGYSTSNNDVDAEKWWINDKWTADQVDTMSFGVDYTLRGFFGADVDTGYEYKLVRRNGDVDGTARNTFRASFDKELRGGEARLAGEGKLVTGGGKDEKRTGTDLTAKLTLTYPVFEGGDLTIGGVYVSSKGDTNVDGQVKDDYTVYQLKAGLEFGF